MKKILSSDQKKKFKKVATSLLVQVCGEDWKKSFATAKDELHQKKVKKMKFKLPVLANIVLFDLKKDIGQKKLANMILKKIHDKNVEHVHMLLKSFLTDAEITSHWQVTAANLDCKKTVKSFDKILKAA